MLRRAPFHFSLFTQLLSRHLRRHVTVPPRAIPQGTRVRVESVLRAAPAPGQLVGGDAACMGLPRVDHREAEAAAHLTRLGRGGPRGRAPDAELTEAVVAPTEADLSGGDAAGQSVAGRHSGELLTSGHGNRRRHELLRLLAPELACVVVTTAIHRSRPVVTN